MQHSSVHALNQGLCEPLRLTKLGCVQERLDTFSIGARDHTYASVQRKTEFLTPDNLPAVFQSIVLGIVLARFELLR